MGHAAADIGTRSCYRLAELIELRKLRKAKQGIDANKLNKGDVKKRRKRPKGGEELDQGGLKPGSSSANRKEVVEDDEYVLSLVIFHSNSVILMVLPEMKTTKMQKRGEQCGITTSRNRPTLSTLTSTCTNPNYPSTQEDGQLTHL